MLVKLVWTNSLSMWVCFVLPGVVIFGCSSEPDAFTPALSNGPSRGDALEVDDAKGSPPAGFEKQSEHPVKKGDTLYAIAAKHYQDGSKWPAIVSANSATLSGPEDLNVGQVLLIPKLSSPALLPEQNRKSSGEKFNLPAVHVLKAGETMFSLSVKYYGTGDHVGLILQENQDAASRAADLQIGDKITIPALPE